MMILKITLPHAQVYTGVHTHAHARAHAQRSRASQPAAALVGVQLTNWKVPSPLRSRVATPGDRAGPAQHGHRAAAARGKSPEGAGGARTWVGREPRGAAGAVPTEAVGGAARGL